MPYFSYFEVAKDRWDLRYFKYMPLSFHDSSDVIHNWEFAELIFSAPELPIFSIENNEIIR